MTISVQSVHLERALEIEASSVVSAQIIGQNVVLTTAGGTVFNAGSVSSIDAVASDIYPAYVATLGAFDWLYYDNLMPGFYKPGANVAVVEPAVPEIGSIGALSWSPDAKYLAVGAQYAGDDLIIYKRNGDVLTELANPAVQPLGAIGDVEWSPDGLYLAVAHTQSPWLSVYKRNGDVLAKLADLPGIVSATTQVAWSPDGAILAISRYSPEPSELMFYDRSGDTFTKKVDVADLPTAYVGGLSWTPDGEYFVGAQAAEGLVIYKRTGSALSRIPNAAGPAFPAAGSASWTPDGIHLAVSDNNNYPRVTIFKRTGNAIAQLETAIEPLGGTLNSVAFSPDGQYLAVCMDDVVSTSDIVLFKRHGDTLTRVPSFPNVDIAQNGLDVTWSPDNIFLTVGYSGISDIHLALFKSAMLPPAGEPTQV